MNRLWTAMQDTCRGDTTLLVGLDDDDETQQDYPEGPMYQVEKGLQRKVVQWINLMARPRAKDYKYIGHFGDDNVPRTVGWDVKLMQALQKTNFAWGDDLEYGQRPAGALCTHIFMRSEIVRKLGYFGPPSIQHMYVDLAWLAWGKATGMTFVPDVIIEHMHFLEQKAPMDESYQLSRQLVGSDLAALQDYLAKRVNRDIRRISPRAPLYQGTEFYQFCWERGLAVPAPAGV
jgi:hypothetical protein